MNERPKQNPPGKALKKAEPRVPGERIMERGDYWLDHFPKFYGSTGVRTGTNAYQFQLTAHKILESIPPKQQGEMRKTFIKLWDESASEAAAVKKIRGLHENLMRERVE